MIPRILAALAVADVRDRVRRSAFLMIVLAAAVLGYLAAPQVSADYTMVKFGAFRGVYDSAYLGTMMAVVGSLWLSWCGFYVVKNSIARDSATGVGQILAATPLSRVAYLLGKFLSNLLVLASMAGVLAVMALVMQLMRGESYAIDLVALGLPFVLLCLPILAITAAAALLSESARPLRGAVGNMIWFFAFPAVYLGGLSAMSMADVGESIQADLLAQHPEVTDTEFSVGLTYEEGSLDRFTWSGLEVTGDLLAGALLLVLLAVLIAALPALWFPRFDPSRQGGIARGAATTPAAFAAAVAVGGTAPWLAAEPSDTLLSPGEGAFAADVRPDAPLARGGAFARMAAGELLLLLKGQSPWWWLSLLGVTIAGLFVTGDGFNIMLLLAWLWPVLIWSRMGTQPYEHDVHLLLDTGPSPRRRLLAGWAAGVGIAALAGIGPLLRMVLASDGIGVAAWLVGALFIPALALLLGSLSRSARLFQLVYFALWYGIFNEIGVIDVMGAVRDGGQLAGPQPLLVAAFAAALLAASLLLRELRHVRR